MDKLLALTVHVAHDDSVWYTTGDNNPVNSGLSPVAFLLSPVCERYQFYRAMGVHTNIPLILALYAKRLKEDIGVVEVCSPLACPTKKLRRDPELALMSMQDFARPTSVGGWHVFDKKDYVSYALANQLHKMGRVDDVALRLYKSHPVYPSLSFIPHLNDVACCYLLSALLDPRWYCDSVHPGRGSKLRAYFGLDLGTVAGALGLQKRSHHHELTKLVIAGWNGERDLAHIQEPPYFIYRIFQAHLARGIVMATLRASHKFLEFIRLTWLAELTARSRSQLESLFVPDYFFKPEEAASYIDHVRRIER